jgi:hypothetical protein
VTKVGGIGWSGTTVPDTTAARYRLELRRLQDALVAFRHVEAGRRVAGITGRPARPAQSHYRTGRT